MDLQRELELARDREVTLHSQLSKAVLCAEKAASERDTFAKIVSTLLVKHSVIMVTNFFLFFRPKLKSRLKRGQLYKEQRKRCQWRGS